MVTEKEFLKVINNKDKGPKPYDTTAEVVRVEDGVAWVHIDGGVEETPAELTINAVKGDKVKVRLVGGQAFLIGNGTAPPTDDRIANDALGVATGARTVAVQAEEVANVTEQKTRPAITSMITYYKLSNGTPDQPTEDDHEGWSDEEPEWNPESDEQLYYSVRSRTVQGLISWTNPHVLSSYANLNILENAILLEVGEGSTVGFIVDSDGQNILDSNDETLIAKLGSITDAYARVEVKSREILQEVSETYVNQGTSSIQSLSSVMKQTAEGVDIYATINGEESDTHSHIDNDSFDIVKGDKVIGRFGANGLIIKDSVYGNMIAQMGYGETSGEGGTENAPFYDLGKRKANTVVGYLSLVEGSGNTASGSDSHAEGRNTTASGHDSHAEGANTQATANYSHAEGAGSIASGSSSHAEGRGSSATEIDAHAEGYGTTASGKASHAEGNATTASGDNSHASGKGTIAVGAEQFVIGRYNNWAVNYAFIIGNGTSSQSKTIFAVDWDGNIHIPAGKQVINDL
jgi:hypothetical protein